MAESTQHKLDRVRPPRVQITYDVEIGGAIQKTELPMVMGVLADLSGETPNPISLKERKFIDLDRDNFDEVLGEIAPSLKLSVPDRIGGKPGVTTPVELKFESLEDFTPGRLVTKVEGLKKLLESRRRLNDLLAKLDGNEELNQELLDVVGKPEELKLLKASNSEEEPANA